MEGDAKDYIRFEVSAGGTSVSLSANTIIAGAQTSEAADFAFLLLSGAHLPSPDARGHHIHRILVEGRYDVEPGGNIHRQPVVTGLAPYAWNYSATPSQAPALTATFDWFHNLAP